MRCNSVALPQFKAANLSPNTGLIPWGIVWGLDGQLEGRLPLARRLAQGGGPGTPILLPRPLQPHLLPTASWTLRSSCLSSWAGTAPRGMRGKHAVLGGKAQHS